MTSPSTLTSTWRMASLSKSSSGLISGLRSYLFQWLSLPRPFSFVLLYFLSLRRIIFMGLHVAFADLEYL